MSYTKFLELCSSLPLGARSPHCWDHRTHEKPHCTRDLLKYTWRRQKSCLGWEVSLHGLLQDSIHFHFTSL